MERTDQNLSAWADEHLLYEVRMLERAAKLMRRKKLTNIEIESFAIHARCLTEFLWKERDDRFPKDARGSDLCDPDEWRKARGEQPPGVSEVGEKAARDVVHLTYGRFSLTEEAKGWDAPLILSGIGDALGKLAKLAIAGRLSDKARRELLDFAKRTAGSDPGSLSIPPVATSMAPPPGR